MKKMLLIMLLLANTAYATENDALWYATDNDKIVKQFGQDFKNRVNALMPKAYEKVLKETVCGKVIAVQPSTFKSLVNYPVVQVTCEPKPNMFARYLVDEELFVVVK